MARVGAQAQPVRDPGPTDNTSVAVRPPSTPAPSTPHATMSGDTATVPVVIATYAGRWLSDLTALGRQANVTFTNPLDRLGLGHFRATSRS
jgi:hypothetical protein